VINLISFGNTTFGDYYRKADRHDTFSEELNCTADAILKKDEIW